MKICAIEIKSKKAVFVILEKKEDGQIKDITGKFKSLSLENDHDHNEILNFTDAIHSHFRLINPDRIVMLTRGTTGAFASSPMSFKIEGLIQSYREKAMEFISPHTTRAFYKKNSLPITPTHNYQEAALELAYYILMNN